jgi:hypothetical protein
VKWPCRDPITELPSQASRERPAQRDDRDSTDVFSLKSRPTWSLFLGAANEGACLFLGRPNSSPRRQKVEHHISECS